MGGEGCPLKQDSYCTIIYKRVAITHLNWKHHENTHEAFSISASITKRGKSTTKVPLPDYSGALLGIRGDDLEKQFHCSINSQHGPRGD